MSDFAFWYTLVLLALMTVILVKELFDPDITIFSVLLLLIVGKVINLKDAFAGFSNSGMLTVGFLFIVARALQETGVLNRLGDIFLGSDIKSTSVRLLRFLFPVSFISAFFNNTPIVAMLIPVITSWARKHDYAVSKFLIPLSYAAILGGTCTLIGTSTNLVVHGLMIENGLGGMSFFEISKVGVPLMIIGVGVISLLSDRYLPNRKEPIVELGDRTREFVIELKVEADYKYLGYTIEEAGLRHLRGLFLFQNDEVQGSLRARDSPNTKPNNGLRRGAFKLSYILYLVDITRVINYSLFLLTGEYRMSRFQDATRPASYVIEGAELHKMKTIQCQKLWNLIT